MYNLDEILDECEDELDKIGISYGDEIKICTNYCNPDKWGQSRHDENGDHIEISNELLNGKMPVEFLKNTVMHELLHTCDPWCGHEGKWEEYAREVNEYYGYDVKIENDYDGFAFV